MPRLSATLAAFLAALVGAASANAGTVSVHEDIDSFDEPFGTATLSYEAAPGETNRLLITMEVGPYTANSWLVNDSALLTVGEGCVALGPNTASCSFNVSEGSLVISVALGDRDDVAVLAGACGSATSPIIAPDLGCGAVVDGGDGRDDLSPNEEGWSRLLGGAGDDYLDANDTAYGGRGDDVLVGSLRVILRDDERRRATSANALFGGPGNDRLFGGPGRDLLRGGSDGDRLSGGAAGDRLYGEGGRDRITGGRGRDLLSGGRSNDTFYARDGYRDEVRGGGGTDRARIDRGRDRLSSIEGLF